MTVNQFEVKMKNNKIKIALSDCLISVHSLVGTISINSVTGKSMQGLIDRPRL